MGKGWGIPKRVSPVDVALAEAVVDVVEVVLTLDELAEDALVVVDVFRVDAAAVEVEDELPGRH